MRTRIHDAHVEFFEQPFVRPLVLSTGAIERITEARAKVTVSVDRHTATGFGSIYLSDLWAWPDPAYTHDQRDAAMRTLCRRIATDLPKLCGDDAAHPLELGLRLHHNVCHSSDAMPVLARGVCLSPFDAAIHDAVGQAIARSAFDFYDAPAVIPSADHLFPNTGAVAAIRAMLARPPKREFPAWLIVGKNDDLNSDLSPWIQQRRYRCFKLKLTGKDTAADVTRTADVYRAVCALGARDPHLSLDSNEANPDADSVLDYLQRLRAADSAAFDAVQYLEQPTGRDIRAHAHDWRRVTQLKPVLLDEGLTDFDLLPEAQSQGWSGLALKTCKGHSFALVAAAWARDNGMMLALQDLTNPGYSAIHAALFAAHVPTINGVELNSPQFAPAANESWLPRLNDLLAPRDGAHRLPAQSVVGLGSHL